MFRRLATLPRSVPVARQSLRAFTKPSQPLSTSPNLASSSQPDIVLSLDARQVGQEIRKRGLASSLNGNHREGGMDRVSLLSPTTSPIPGSTDGIFVCRILSSDCYTRLDPDMKSRDISGYSQAHQRMVQAVYCLKLNLRFLSECTRNAGRRGGLMGVGSEVLSCRMSWMIWHYRYRS
jgi:hypothetical protein